MAHESVTPSCEVPTSQFKKAVYYNKLTLVGNSLFNIRGTSGVGWRLGSFVRSAGVVQLGLRSGKSLTPCYPKFHDRFLAESGLEVQLRTESRACRCPRRCIRYHVDVGNNTRSIHSGTCFKAARGSTAMHDALHPCCAPRSAIECDAGIGSLWGCVTNKSCHGVLDYAPYGHFPLFSCRIRRQRRDQGGLTRRHE